MNDNSTDIDPMIKLKQSRKARYVGRFAGQQLLNPPNIAEHEQAVASMFIWLARTWSVEITPQQIDFVLNHDILETETGDLLFHTKHDGNEARWDLIEATVAKKFPHMAFYTDAFNPLNDKTEWLFKYCDYLEGIITCLEEQKMGNGNKEPKDCIRQYQAAMEGLFSRQSCVPQALSFYDRVMEVF